MTHYTRNLNRKTVNNYIEIYIKSDLKKIIKLGKKRIYHSKLKNIVGVDIKPEFPKKPHIVIKNNFKRNTNSLAKELIKKIIKIIK